MNVYFCGSIRGGRELQSSYKSLVDRLKQCGHTVLSEHVSDTDVLQRESCLSSHDIFRRDVAWLEQADIVVAEVTVPSLGVGYEVAHALFASKPVLCLCRKDADLSAMIAGNPHKRLDVEQYDDLRSATEAMVAWVGRHQQA